MNRDKLKVITFPGLVESLHETHWKKSPHRTAKSYVMNAMEKTGYSFRQIAEAAGVKNETQFKVFVQVVDISDTYSYMFKPYRLLLRIVVKDRIRTKRNIVKIHVMKGKIIPKNENNLL